MVGEAHSVLGGPHVHVGNDHVDVGRAFQDDDGLVDVCGLEDLEACTAKDISHHEPQQDLVLGNNDLYRPR